MPNAGEKVRNIRRLSGMRGRIGGSAYQRQFFQSVALPLNHHSFTPVWQHHAVREAILFAGHGQRRAHGHAVFGDGAAFERDPQGLAIGVVVGSDEFFGTGHQGPEAELDSFGRQVTNLHVPFIDQRRRGMVVC